MRVSQGAVMEKTQYLMESDNEKKRLAVKTDENEIIEHLKLVSFQGLKNGSHIVDAGAGVGIVSGVMAEKLKRARKKADITLLDLSENRLDAAKIRLKNTKNIRFHFKQCVLEKIPIKSSSVDFIFCRFVFEYLKDKTKVFNELYRILKPGGTLVTGDLDMNCLCHYPLDSRTERELISIADSLSKKGLLDFHAGRKLYSYFYGKRMSKIEVFVTAHHLFYGDMEDRDVYNWENKLNQLIKIQKGRKLEYGTDILRFKKKFLKFLRSSHRFSYTPYIMVKGLK